MSEQKGMDRVMNEQKMYGYMRVSTREQNKKRQQIALLEMGVPVMQIYMDRQSGKDFKRTQYQRLLRKLDCNSVLFVKSIDRLGRNYTDLKTVTIGKNIASIGAKAFYKCKKLTKISIPSKVTKIEKLAFAECSGLKTVTIGKNVTSIGDKAFYKCKKLSKIVIPAKVKKIGKEAFSGCSKLKSITIKTSKLTTKSVGAKAFKGIYAKAVIKVPKKKKAAYKKMLQKKGIGKKVIIR